MSEDQAIPEGKREATPSELAYVQMSHNMRGACFRVLQPTFRRMPDLLGNLAGLTAAFKTREVEIQAMLELLVEAKIIDRNQFFDRVAALGEKYVREIDAMDAQEKDAAPRIAIATSLNGAN